MRQLDVEEMLEDAYRDHLRQLLAEGGWSQAEAEDEARLRAMQDVDAFLFPEEAVRY